MGDGVTLPQAWWTWESCGSTLCSQLLRCPVGPIWVYQAFAVPVPIAAFSWTSYLLILTLARVFQAFLLLKLPFGNQWVF